MIHGFLPVFVRAFYDTKKLPPFSHRGVCRRLIFCLSTVEVGSHLAVRCAWLIGFAYTHNEKPCPVTIDRIIRYEGVQEEKMSTTLMYRVALTDCLFAFSIFLIFAVRSVWNRALN